MENPGNILGPDAFCLAVLRVSRLSVGALRESKRFANICQLKKTRKRRLDW